MLYFFGPLPSKCSCTNSSEKFHIPSIGNFTIGNMASSSVTTTLSSACCFGDLKQLSLPMATQGLSPVLIKSSEGGFTWFFCHLWQLLYWKETRNSFIRKRVQLYICLQPFRKAAIQWPQLLQLGRKNDQHVDNIQLGAEVFLTVTIRASHVLPGQTHMAFGSLCPLWEPSHA